MNPKTVCPDCKIKRKSIIAKRCMECHTTYRNTGMIEYVSRSKTFREKIRNKVRELAKEQGVNPNWITALDDI